MLKFFLACFLCLLANAGTAQHTLGLTHQPDTSFTNYSAYASAKQKYPEIHLVTDTLPATVASIQNIIYRTINDIPLKLDVFYPRKHTGHKLPAIMIIHGGGWRSGSRSQHHALAAQLAARGFICFTPSYRLSTQALYPAAVQDLQAALQWIIINGSKYSIDTGKIAVLGFSAGGQLAALLGTTAHTGLFNEGHTTIGIHKPVKAIVDIDGTLAFIHPESGEGDDGKKLSAATLWFGYSKTENPQLWQQAGALTHADENTPPTLFINSAVERMHAGRNDYIDKLSRYHIYTEVHTFPNSPHTFCLFEPWFTPTVNYTVDFLKRIFNK